MLAQPSVALIPSQGLHHPCALKEAPVIFLFVSCPMTTLKRSLISDDDSLEVLLICILSVKEMWAPKAVVSDAWDTWRTRQY